MADVAAAKELGGFENKLQYSRLTYDFANDTGAAAAYTLANCPDKLVVLRALVHVETACTSAGSATVIVGATGDTDAFMDVTAGAVANLIDDYTEEDATALGTVVAAGGDILLTIGTAALTAGKINVELLYTLVD